MQEIEQDKHYVERFQLIPVDEQTYTYEAHTVGPNQVQPNGGPIDGTELMKRDSQSHEQDRDNNQSSNGHSQSVIGCGLNDRDIPLSDQQNVPTTVYVSQSNDEAEVLRYSTNAQVRYEEDAYQQARYEYQPHPGSGHPDDIKVELVRHHSNQQHPAKVHIYEHESGPRSELHHPDEHHHTEPKIHYTNLDSIASQNYYISTEGFQAPGGGYTYLSTAPSKDFTVFQGSPNTVLYKGLFRQEYIQN